MTRGAPHSPRRFTLFSHDLRALRVGRALLELTPSQADLLRILHDRFGQLVSNDDMIRGMYGASEPPNAYTVVRLRLGDLRMILTSSGSAWEIVSQYGKGVMLREIPRYAWP